MSLIAARSLIGQVHHKFQNWKNFCPEMFPNKSKKNNNSNNNSQSQTSVPAKKTKHYSSKQNNQIKEMVR